MIKLENYKDPEGEILETYSVGDLLRIVQGWKKNPDLNHKNIYEVPVYLQDGFEKYVIHQASLSFGESFSTSFEFSKTYGKCNFVAPDKRPEGGGEYWQTCRDNITTYSLNYGIRTGNNVNFIILT